MNDRLQHQVVRWRIPEHVMGGRALRAADQRHTDRCLRCQAEVASFRTIARTLHSMRNPEEPAPSGLVLRVMANLSRPLAEGRRGPDRVVVVASVMVVAAAMALLGRHRLRPVS
ncbi:MAG: hypothetical protein ACXW15_11245 [Acidimicrobiia bacterium]